MKLGELGESLDIQNHHESPLYFLLKVLVFKQGRMVVCGMLEVCYKLQLCSCAFWGCKTKDRVLIWEACYKLL
jgi:hypothetical protein